MTETAEGNKLIAEFMGGKVNLKINGASQGTMIIVQKPIKKMRYTKQTFDETGFLVKIILILVILGVVIMLVK